MALSEVLLKAPDDKELWNITSCVAQCIDNMDADTKNAFIKDQMIIRVFYPAIARKLFKVNIYAGFHIRIDSIESYNNPRLKHTFKLIWLKRKLFPVEIIRDESECFILGYPQSSIGLSDVRDHYPIHCELSGMENSC